MSFKIDEQIEMVNELSLMSHFIFEDAIKEGKFSIALRNVEMMIDNHILISLLKWRRGEKPSSSFQDALDQLAEGCDLLFPIANNVELSKSIKCYQTVYAAYFLGQPHPVVDLTMLEEQPKIAGFFGNVLMGYADISDWPKYRDAIPKSKRYDLARRTNELYAGLLAGSVSAEEGVKLGEQLWAEREDDTFFDTGTGGFGDDNETMVDYQLGAILKKIGSTVPTVHAWRW